jgi:Transglycosylase
MVMRVLQDYELHHDWVAYDHVAPTLAHAAVASEDNFFCRESSCFETDTLLEQIDNCWQGDRRRGASTITMQKRGTCYMCRHRSAMYRQYQCRRPCCARDLQCLGPAEGAPNMAVASSSGRQA